MYCHAKHLLLAPLNKSKDGAPSLAQAEKSDVEKYFGQVGAAKLRARQISMDTFHFSQISTISKDLSRAINHVERLLREGGTECTYVPPLLNMDGKMGDGVPAKVKVPLTEPARTKLEKDLQHLKNWDMDFNIIFSSPSSELERPWIKVEKPDAATRRLVSNLETAEIIPGQKFITDYITVFCESKSLCRIVYDKFVASSSCILNDPMSVMVMFSGLRIDELLALREKTEMNGSLAKQYLFSEHPLSTLHCGKYHSGNPVHVPCENPYVHWKADKGKRGSAKSISSERAKDRSRFIFLRFKDRAAGSTSQCRLEYKRIRAIEKTLQEDTRVRNVASQESIQSCERCGNEKVVVYDKCTNDIICIKCGTVLAKGEGTETYFDKNRLHITKKTTSFTYDPGNHFRSWLNHVQAKETTYIPDSVIETVEEERKIHRVPKSQMTSKHVISFLHKRGLSQYYKNSFKILYQITKIMPLRLAPEHEMCLGFMFLKMKNAWPFVKPSNRINLLSYSLVLHNYCSLQGWDHYLHLFPLPKNDKRRQKQEGIFQDLEKFLKWDQFRQIPKTSEIFKVLKPNPFPLQPQQCSSVF